MQKKDTPTPSRIPLIFCIVACTALLIFVVVALFQSGPQTQKPSLAMMSSSTIPYVTETKEFTDYLHSALEEFGPEAVQSQIKELYADAEYGEQHMSFHYLGEVLYEVEGAVALPVCEDWYGFGCYHGFLLGAISKEGYEVVPSLDQACFDKHGNTMETETCQHGIGHGLLEYSGRDPIEAVTACDLVTDVYSKLGCASGVFMEYFAPTQSDTRARVAMAPEFDEQDPFNVCAEFSGTRLATCLFEIHPWWTDYVGLSAQKTEELCNSVGDQEAREFCLIGYGNFKGPFVDKARPFCDEFVNEESRMLCRAGILWAAEHHNGSPGPTRACTELPEAYRATCFEKGRFTCQMEGRCEEERG